MLDAWNLMLRELLALNARAHVVLVAGNHDGLLCAQEDSSSCRHCGRFGRRRRRPPLARARPRPRARGGRAHDARPAGRARALPVRRRGDDRPRRRRGRVRFVGSPWTPGHLTDLVLEPLHAPAGRHGVVARPLAARARAAARRRRDDAVGARDARPAVQHPRPRRGEAALPATRRSAKRFSAAPAVAPHLWPRARAPVGQRAARRPAALRAPPRRRLRVCERCGRDQNPQNHRLPAQRAAGRPAADGAAGAITRNTTSSWQNNPNFATAVLMRPSGSLLDLVAIISLKRWRGGCRPWLIGRGCLIPPGRSAAPPPSQSQQPPPPPPPPPPRGAKTPGATRHQGDLKTNNRSLDVTSSARRLAHFRALARPRRGRACDQRPHLLGHKRSARTPALFTSTCLSV